MTKKTIKGTQQSRRSRLDVSAADTETRSLRAALSSTAPVKRYFGTEVLEHSADAIDMTRAADGLPLLVNHNDGALPIGRVRNVGLDDDGVLRGDLSFSDATQEARDAWGLAKDGTLSDVSIRYSINDYEVRGETGSEEYRVTSWTPLEASVVSVPADASVGIGRQMNLEGIDMPEDKTEAAPAPAPTKKAAPSASRAQGRKDGAAAERQRFADINAIADNFADSPDVRDLARAAIEDGTSVEDFKDSILGALSGAGAEPLAKPVPQSRTAVATGATHNEKRTEAFEEALHIKAGNFSPDEAAKRAASNEYAGLSIVEMVRSVAQSQGVNTRGWSPMDVASHALRYIDPGTANLDTTNFPAVLENVMNKALFNGFAEAPVTWNLWCGTDSAADFKPGTRPGLSHFTSLAVVAENAQIQDGIVNDKKEAFQVQTYARKFSVTRQTLVNDDLASLSTVAGRMGQAAGRTVDEQVYAFVEANGAMTEDGLNLFANRTAPNDNLLTGDISTTTIGLARTTMAKMVDTNNVVLGIVPQYMVVPMELEQTMLELSVLNADPIRERRDNVYRQMWQPVATPRLTDANDWYMFGMSGDHINVVFLNGTQAPMMARDEGWSTLAAHWRVVLDFTVMAVDYRAAVKFANV